MKSLKTIISILFIVGTIGLIVYDSMTRKSVALEKNASHQDSVDRHLKK